MDMPSAPANRALTRPGVGPLLLAISWPELRHHPWQHASAWGAVVLGVALAFAVHLINESALGEFSAAVRAVNGQPDFELRDAQRGFGGGFDELVYGRVAAHPGVAVASPVLELETVALDAAGGRVPVRVLGIDALVAGPLTPRLLPRPAAGVDAQVLFDPGALFMNAAAARRFGDTGRLTLASGAGTATLDVRGRVGAEGGPLVVMDIAGAQATFGGLGRISRIDVRLHPGVDRATLLRELALPAGLRAAAPEESATRVSNLSRAYRVNLTVLALVALFTGAFLVFSILSLSVAKRFPQLALLGVLGLSGRERLSWVLAESAVLGLAGSVAGLALGTGLAALALRLLAGDLGGGYFPGVTPALQWSSTAALAYGALGVAAALAGGWLPARAAQRMAPAQVLKGLAAAGRTAAPARLALVCMLGAGALALAPPVGGLPIGAYASVACLLVGGIAAIPLVVRLLLMRKRTAAPKFPHPPRGAAAGLWRRLGALPGVSAPTGVVSLLAIERARHQHRNATVAVAGVVASLALSVALTVMVGSFRDSVAAWLDQVLPAELYLRSASTSASADSVFLPDGLLEAVRGLPGVERAIGQRVVSIQIDPALPAVTLLARPLGDVATALPLVGRLVPAAPGVPNIYVSEAMVSLYGAVPGSTLTLPLPRAGALDATPHLAHVRGVWRDYARQHGAIAIDAADYQSATGDLRLNDLALWLRPGAMAAQVRADVKRLAGDTGWLEFASSAEVRATSLRIFDRSFAVTYWLQAVAIGIGLVGMATSFSAQVLARRRELGALIHLGLTRTQVGHLVALEGALWSGAGALLGSLLGLAVSVVLVKVVNPQSFHWTMELAVPWGRVALLALGVVGGAALTSWLAARLALRANLARLVKQDW